MRGHLTRNDTVRYSVTEQPRDAATDQRRPSLPSDFRTSRKIDHSGPHPAEAAANQRRLPGEAPPGLPEMPPPSPRYKWHLNQAGDIAATEHPKSVGAAAEKPHSAEKRATSIWEDER